MIIGTCGFGESGSSAISDYLMEYNSIQVLDKIEFNWVYAVDGLIDLENHLCHPHSRTSESICAIDRYSRLPKFYYKYYTRAGISPSYLRESTDRFLDTIIQVKWKWHFKRREGLGYKLKKKIAGTLISIIEKYRGRQLNIWPYDDVALSVFPENYQEAARKHVKELLSAMGADFNRPIVLDQPYSGNNPEACFSFFEDPYAIVVDRDPRDNYVFAKKKNIVENHFIPLNSVENYVKYYRILRQNQPYNKKNERILSIHFEDMIYRYDETTHKIQQFLHLPQNPNPKTIFIPEMSMPNTQVWKRYPEYKNDIEYIERELKDYLYDFTSFPEPDPKGKMFFGQSPNHL